MNDDFDFDMEIVEEDELDELGADGASDPEKRSPSGTKDEDKKSSVESDLQTEVVGADKADPVVSEEINEAKKTRSRLSDLPDSWSVNQIREVAEVVGGSTPSTKNETYWGGDIPWATPTDVTGLLGTTITQTEDTITKEGLDSASTHVLPSCSVLMTSRATIGACAVNTVPMTTNQGFQSLVPGDSLNTWYLFYRMLREAPYLESLGAGSTFSEVSKRVVEKVDIAVPPLPEQRKIASVLYAVDQAIQKTEAIIEQAQRVKRGLMQDLFQFGLDKDGHLRRPDKNPEAFRDPGYGKIPKSWDIVQLADLVPDDAPITYGIVKPGDHHPGGVPVVKVKDIIESRISEEELLLTDPKIHEKYDRAELEEGDLLFSIRGTVGRMAFVPQTLQGGNITQDTARIRPEGIHPSYLRYYLDTEIPQTYFQRNKIGQAVQGINLEALREAPVFLPSEEEQRSIVEVVDSYSDLIRNELDDLKAFRRLKKGLMQDLLTGEVRTADKAIDVLDEVKAHG